MSIFSLKLSNSFVGRWKKRRMRQQIRAWNHIRMGNDPSLTNRLAVEMGNNSLIEDMDPATRLFNNIPKNELELRLRHNILTRIINDNFFSDLTLSIYNKDRAIASFLPKPWQYFLEGQGFQISQWGRIKWFLFQIRVLAASVVQTFRLTVYSIKEHKLKPELHYWIAENAPKAALAIIQPGKEKKTYINALSSILKNGDPLGRAWVTKINQISAQDCTDYHLITLPYPPLGRNRRTISFFLTSLALCFQALIGWIGGSSAMAVLASDAVVANYIEFIEDNLLPEWYIISNSQIGARSPWTFIAERRGVKVGMAFYSTNNKALQLRNKMPFAQFPGYKFLNWPRYFVWDSYHANWIRSIVTGEPEIIEAGYIPVLDKYYDSLVFPHNAVAVFDMTILRPSVYASMGITWLYYSDKIVRTFLFEAQKVLEKSGKVMVVKPKRRNPTNSKRYLSIYTELKMKKNVIIIDPSAGVKNVIDNTIATISIPYTSTGVVAKLHNKPSVFFDPLNVLENNETTGHGLPLIQSNHALEEWVAKL